MSIEAMKQALEALETLNSGDSYKTHNAATALRLAIAEAEKPWVKTYAGGKPNYTTPVHASDIPQERVDEKPKHGHEPVAWIKDDELAFMSAAKMLDATEWKTNLGLKPEHGDVPLYTTPPKREWVGLTDEEISYYG